MSRRLIAVPAALLAALLLLTAVAAAPADTNRTTDTPAQLRAMKASYEKEIARRYGEATRTLDAQLRRHPRKPTVVMDVDETTLSNWNCFDAANFELTALATCVVTGRSVAFPAAKAFIKHARARHVAIAFITGTPQAACQLRERNLIKQGIKKPFTIACRPASDTRRTVVPYKSGARKALVKRGATIVLNIGDQQSDLDGGYANKVQHLNNPLYVID